MSRGVGFSSLGLQAFELTPLISLRLNEEPNSGKIDSTSSLNNFLNGEGDCTGNLEWVKYAVCQIFRADNKICTDVCLFSFCNSCATKCALLLTPL